MASPKHAQLTETLRLRIADDFYEGGRLPSEADLSREFHASRTTVRQALLSLQNEGLVRAESGVGYFVRNVRHFAYRPQGDFRRSAQITDADSFTQAATEEGRTSEQQIEVAIIRAVDDVARHLKVTPGTIVVRRSRLRLLDGEPYQLNDSYYPRDVVEGTEIMFPDDITRGANAVLAEHGHAQVQALDEIWIRMPRPEEVERLRILPGTPVAEHIITGLTATGRPVRMVRAVLPGDRNVVTFERTHPDYEAHSGDQTPQ